MSGILNIPESTFVPLQRCKHPLSPAPLIFYVGRRFDHDSGLPQACKRGPENDGPPARSINQRTRSYRPGKELPDLLQPGKIQAVQLHTAANHDKASNLREATVMFLNRPSPRHLFTTGTSQTPSPAVRPGSSG